MIYSSWDIECDRLKLVIMGHFFCPFTSPLKTQKIKILKKWKNLLEISSFYRCVPKTTIIWVTVPEIWSDTDRIICNFGLFLPFYPPPSPNNPENINFEKNEKKHLEMPSFYICVPKITITWWKIPEIWNVTDNFLSFWAKITPLLTSKIKIWIKNQKLKLSFYSCVP